MPDDSQQPIGRVLDERYRVLEVLGEGGMGTVYLGEHVVIGRQVAIKVLGAKLAKSDDFAERFRREAIAAGRLDHPNCVPVTDSGQLEDGSAYMVMELVKGQTLGALLREEGGLAPMRALRILRHILRGLTHAHHVEIVHRDIKPENIMLIQRDADCDFARILDFGIAKLRDEEGQSSQSLTHVGMAVGTPSYLSPEQAFGDTVDYRSDLYSCAVLLFEMLSGRTPYISENSMGVLTKHATAPIPHLWDFAEHLREFPILDAITVRGLSKGRDERFQSAGEFIAAIDHALEILGFEFTPAPQLHAQSLSPWPPLSAPIAGTPLHAESAQPGLPAERVQPDSPWPPPARPRMSTADDSPMSRGPTELAEALPRQLSESEEYQAMRGHPNTPRKRGLVALGIVILAAVAAAMLLSSGGNNGKGILMVLPAQRDALLKQGIEQLENGKTCKDRLEGVEILRRLHDERTIPSLEKARRRMRGGVLGIGKKNANRCLQKAAQEALDAFKQ